MLVHDSPAGRNKNSKIPSEVSVYFTKNPFTRGPFPKKKVIRTCKKNNPYLPGKGFVRVKLAAEPHKLVSREQP